jgi:trigger factor
MQVVEKAGEGLSRTYGVTVPATELGAALDLRIDEILPTLKLKGFRPGKVPKAHVRRLYGKALMGEVIEKTLNETSQKVISESRLRVASRPDVKPVSDMNEVLAGREDLAYDIEVEVMPEFEPVDVSTLTLERPVYRSSDEELDAALATLAAQNRTYRVRGGVTAVDDADEADDEDDAVEDAAGEDQTAEALAVEAAEGEAAQGETGVAEDGGVETEATAALEAEPAVDGDQVLIDFVGLVDGEPFEGGSVNDAEIVLGSGQFIPGFEEQLIGARAGDHLSVSVIFPENYPVEDLQGKPAVFNVTVKEVREPVEGAADDALALRMGLGDLEALKEAVRASLDREFVAASRFKLKRALLDVLDALHDIPLPSRMVEAEFEGIWKQVEKDRDDGELSPEDAAKSEDDLRAEYRLIARRRVRLGLVLAEIGRRANVSVTEAQLSQAMRAEATRYGAQAQEIFDMLRRNPDIQAQMRAPLYEENVVDYIMSQATITDVPVSKEELLREDDLPEGYGAAGEAPPAADPIDSPGAPAEEDGLAEAASEAGSLAESAPEGASDGVPETALIETAAGE